MAGLLDALKQYIQDAAPGGALNQEQPTALSGLLDYGKKRVQYIGGLLDPQSQISQDAQNWHKRTKNGLIDQLAGRQTPAAEQAYQTMMGMAGIAPIGMTAWHGSPHKFDKFSLDKIGTGEGAQAYGHGLYLAENPETASMYRASVAPKQGPQFGLEDGNPVKGIATLIAAKGAKGEEMARKHYANYVPDVEAAIQQAKQAVNEGSNLYKTDIPDEAVARFLDWDKPLSQQAPEVQAALKSMTDDVVRGGFDLSRSPRNVARAFDDSSTDEALKVLQQKYGVTNSGGQYFDKNGNPVPADAVQRHIDKIAGKGYDNAGQLYSDLTHILGSQSDISATLRNNGIPGIRYLDGGSRSAGQGSSNFVAFDPEMIRILERNGKATGQSPWKPGEWK